MLTVKTLRSSRNALKYYLNEYASESGETHGRWFGTFAKSLGLEGTNVDPKDFENLLRGFAPDGRALCQNAGDKHRAGWDMTFSAPKSVSVLWSSAPKTLRGQIEAAHNRAALSAMDYMEKTSAIVREGKGGIIQSSANLAFATFTHSNNRNGDPQLHTHTFVMNVAQKKDSQKTLTLEGKRFFEAKMASSAVYKVELSKAIQDLGFEVYRTADSFEVSCVPKDVIEFQSSRSKEIEALLREKGLDRKNSTSDLKEVASLSTRQKKSFPPRDFETWEKENKEMGFTKETISKHKKSHSIAPQLNSESLEGISKQSIEKISHSESVFSQHEITQKVLEDLIGKTDSKTGYQTIRSLLNKDEILQITEKETRYFSTQGMVALEKKLLEYLKGSSDKHLIPNEKTDPVIERFTLLPDQKKAFKEITESNQNVNVLQGYAGTGKSYLMKAIKEAYESNGYQIIGVSPSNKAAKELQNSSGIKSRSIDSFLLKTITKKEKLPENLLLIVDEAGMVDSRRMVVLQDIASSNNAKLLLVGDERQIQPIMAGQPFGSLKGHTNFSQITTVFRQRRQEEADAILEARAGDIQKTLDFFDKEKRLFVNTAKKIKNDLIQGWNERNDVSKGVFHKGLVVTSTNKSVDEINDLIRNSIKAKGNLLTEEISINTHLKKEVPFSKGDFIMFCRTDNRFGVLNSDTGYINSINEKSVNVQLTSNSEVSDKIVNIDLSQYNDLRHSYAITANKAQASTFESSLAYIDSRSFNRPKFYAALSRGKENNSLYVPEELVIKEKEKSPSYEKMKESISFLLSNQGLKKSTLDYKGWKETKNTDDVPVEKKAWDVIHNQLKALVKSKTQSYNR